MLLYQNENFGRSYDFRRRHHDRFVIPAHIHEFSELCCVTEGTMTLFISGAEYQAPEGSMAFVLPNEIHSYTDKTPCHVFCAVFSNDFIRHFLSLVGDRVPTSPIVDFSAQRELLDAIDQTSFDDTLRLTGLLNLLYAEFWHRTSFLPRPKAGIQVSRAAVDYIAKHFTEDITLSSVAAQLGYHEKYLSSALHALTGMNFCTFLASYRVDFAKGLLREKEITISTAAHEAGFSSINTFNRVFKKLTGVTPGKYRSGGEEK